MTKKSLPIVLAAIAFIIAIIPGAHAEDDKDAKGTKVFLSGATVLPKGRFAVRLDSQFYFPIEEKFDENGDAEDIAEDFNTRLDGTVFPQLNLVEAGFGLPSGFASFGNSDVEYKYNVQIFDFYLFYGLTDRLTLGAKVPYWNFKNNVTARLDTSTATVGINSNPAIPSPIAPLALGATPLTTADIQLLLKTEYGFDPVEDWSDNGFSDIEIGARYQYYRSEKWQLAFTGSILTPTGRTDDPDSLVDFPFGSGAWGLSFYLNNNFTALQKYGLSFTGTFRYVYYFPTRMTVRVPDNVDQPIVGLDNKEKVDLRYGSDYRIDLEGRYLIGGGLSVFLFYRYLQKFKDSVSGDRGLAYDELEKQSDQKEQQVRVGLNYSTIPLYMKKEFPVPFEAKVYYRNRFAGENVLKSQYIGLDLTVFF
jgi:hypothetical protein